MMLNSSSWFRPDMPWYSVGLVIYLVFIVLFAYFYTSITFNPLEVANNMKKSGGFIPGIPVSYTHLLMPKRVKRRKQFRGTMTGKALRGNVINYGEYGLVATERCV